MTLEEALKAAKLRARDLRGVRCVAIVRGFLPGTYSVVDYDPDITTVQEVSREKR